MGIILRRYGPFIVGAVVGLMAVMVANVVATDANSECGIAGVLDDGRCQDEINRVGFPLVFWEKGGYAYRNVVYWRAVIVDTGFALILCVVFGYITQMLIRLFQRLFYVPGR